ncbi:hypothetical protein ACFE04_001065 [Oxalis oulophora]
MDQNRRLMCPENRQLVNHMMDKIKELADKKKPNGLPEKLDMTLSKAYNNVCNEKLPIKTLKELSQIKGVGKWMLKLMQGFFETGSGNSEPEDMPNNKGKKLKGAKRYVPQKSSVSYALLITLYRGIANGSEFMYKKDLTDVAEASGLSRAPILPEKAKGKPGQFGSSSRDWYTGWSCMKTLITKNLVVKSSNPAKYMLTQEGREVARECLMRSSLEDPLQDLANNGSAEMATHDEPGLNSVPAESDDEEVVVVSRPKKSVNVPPETLDRFTNMGYSKDQIIHAYNDVLGTSKTKEVSSLWPAVLCRLREEEVYGFQSNSNSLRNNFHATSKPNSLANGEVNPNKDKGNRMDSAYNVGQMRNFNSTASASNFSTFRPCSSSVSMNQGGSAWDSNKDGWEAIVNKLSVPPIGIGERFKDIYEVVLILDDREQFTSRGNQSRKIVESYSAVFKIPIEVRRLPVGDAIWIARHKYLHTEYVLDFIVERKRVDDLRSSIRDNRYKEQKLKLVRCGLKKLIYIVEGDPNCSEAAESIKTACFTTEILEGFDVQRTNSLADTMKRYGHLTHAITQYYTIYVPENLPKSTIICPPFEEFIKRCEDAEKRTVSDVFAVQLMQVPQVTEKIAETILDMYPTLVSLAQAYSVLRGDLCAQQELLRKQSNNVISGVASKNVFELIWGN